MGLLSIFKRKAPEPVEMGPLFDDVRSAMGEVQAYARSHGGTIDLLGVSGEGDVKVRFRGTCNGCPLSSVTLKVGIEERLRTLVPGVRKVIEVK
jgi:Fe-S cluster biogenesis protein NfuA